MTVSRQDAVDFITSSNGRFVSLAFTKRTTGEIREMLCRLHVRKHLAGGESAYNFSEKGLIPVWDRTKQEYRSVPIEGITRIKIRGEWHDVQ